MTNSTYKNGTFLLLCLIGFSAFFSSYLRIPVLPLYATALGAGPAQIGIINGTFMLTAGLLSIPGGLLADLVGRKPSIIGGIVAVALSSFLIANCRTPEQMALVYVLFGAGLAAFAPGMLSLVADVLPPERLGQAYGWYSTAIYTAMTFGPATGGILAKTAGLRDVFLISGALSSVTALLALLTLPSVTVRRRPDVHALLAGSISLLHNYWLIACLIATVGSCIGFGIFLTFLPLYATSRGLDPAQIGIVFAAQAMTNVVSRIPIGTCADKLDKRWIVASGLFTLSMALVLFGQIAHLAGLVLCAVCLGIGMALTFTAIGALIALQVPPLQRGLAMGMYNSCIYLGMMSGSAVLGITVKRIGYPLGFAAAGGVALISLILFTIILRNRSNAAP